MIYIWIPQIIIYIYYLNIYYYLLLLAGWRAELAEKDSNESRNIDFLKNFYSDFHFSIENSDISKGA